MTSPSGCNQLMADQTFDRVLKNGREERLGEEYSTQ